MKSLSKALILTVSLMLLATTACECGDAGFQDATPKLDNYFVGTNDDRPEL
ncbi:MAG: hypothetical protein JRF33_22120, partial [Deltaproteobacteria bacterium]|nr:hypothetical protein [Deltaproteobacteria bacterium]